MGGSGGPGADDASAGGAGGSGGVGGAGGHGGGGGGGASYAALSSLGGNFVGGGRVIGSGGAGGTSAGNPGLNGFASVGAGIGVVLGPYHLGRPPVAVHARIACLGSSSSFPTLPLASDADPGETFTFSITTPPPVAHGTATQMGNALVFTPAPGFTGSTSFGIRATDSTNQSVDGFAVVQVGQHCPADFNRSGVVSTQDIFDFLTAYFTGCP